MFLNLPVQTLKRSVDFFTELGFTFNPQFTSEDSTCMVIGSTMYVMLLEHPKFSGFIDKPIAEKTTTESIISFACESKEEVSAICEKAISLGARSFRDSYDYGFMFGWGFEDLDGHLWEFFWMDQNHVM